MAAKLLFLFLAILSIALNSCKTYMGYDELRHLRKGMSARDAESEFDLEPKKIYTIRHEGATYQARRYDMQIGVSTTTTTDPGFVGTNGVYNYGTTTQKKSANTIGYLLLFRDDRLLYWGFLQEFSKSEDPNIFALSSEIKKLYYQDNN